MKIAIATFSILMASLALVAITNPRHDIENWKGCVNVTYRVKIPIAPEDAEFGKYKDQLAAVISDIDRKIPLMKTAEWVFPSRSPSGGNPKQVEEL
jgi:hypothetical protein